MQSDLGFGITVWNAGYPDNGIPSVSSYGKLKKPDIMVFLLRITKNTGIFCLKIRLFLFGDETVIRFTLS